ncbi:MAG: hypothetical protein K2O10_01730, partial [Muribaculaceae bacterium]|nr:hypothetical protein [Muribaculaceae bacterium]
MMSVQMAANAPFKGFDTRVESSHGGAGFVTKGEIDRMLAEWGVNKKTAAAVDLQGVEDRLNAIDNIEHASVERLPDNRIRVTVTPMVPVARIFDSAGRSYYINSAGKRLTASSRFRLDVPVISGDFDSLHPATAMLPLVRRLEGDPAWKAIVSQYRYDRQSGDIIVVPVIRGHVINLGDTTALESKLGRVMAMYHKVLPLKGWDYYDTLSVKWGGQCVASRRDKVIPPTMILFDQEGEAETDDIDAMLTTTDTVVAVPTHPAAN